ncbi:MAG: GLPGLI family protein [Bacteroidales bacterium]
MGIIQKTKRKEKKRKEKRREEKRREEKRREEKLISPLNNHIYSIAMKYFFTFLLFTISIYLDGQPLRWKNFRNPSDKLLADTCIYSISYRYKYYEREDKKIPYFDHCMLDIGNRISSYYSLYTDQMDSIMYNNRKRGSMGIDPRTELNKKYKLNSTEKGIYDDYYKNFPNKGELTVSTGIMSTEYIYNEPSPVMNWKITGGTDSIILGYPCNKADLLFRGRSYVAWFTPQIPINNGPWKFQGLPGLILKVTESNGYFEWEITEIQNTPKKPIYVYAHNGVKHKKCTRLELLKILRLLWQDPIAFQISTGMKSHIRKNGEYVPAKPGDKQYPPVPAIELE